MWYALPIVGISATKLPRPSTATARRDVPIDKLVDAYDPKFFIATDPVGGGRRLATYRGTDSDPKETFIHHPTERWARIRGPVHQGGPILRDRDADLADKPYYWASEPAASDRYERHYYALDYRGYVSAIFAGDGTLVEQVRYSGTGVPFNIPLGDVEGNGKVESTGLGNPDYDQIEYMWKTPAYHVRGDLDLDGTVDAADLAIAQARDGMGTGRGYLSTARCMQSMMTPTFESRYGMSNIRVDVHNMTSTYLPVNLRLNRTNEITLTVNKATFIVPVPLPEPPPPDFDSPPVSPPVGPGSTMPEFIDASCREMVDRFLDEEIVWMLHEISAKCQTSCGQPLKIVCSKKSEGVCKDPASGFAGASRECPGTITICINPSGTPVSPHLRTTLLHELIHARQACSGKPLQDSACGSLCRELEAYRGSGECNTFSTCCTAACRSSAGHGGYFGGSMEKCWQECMHGVGRLCKDGRYTGGACPL